jgi:hypothetical protein
MLQCVIRNEDGVWVVKTVSYAELALLKREGKVLNESLMPLGVEGLVTLASFANRRDGK